MEENENAPLWRHAVVFHKGEKEPSWYRMRIVKAHRSPLERQIEEGHQAKAKTARATAGTVKAKKNTAKRYVESKRSKQN